MKFNYKQVGKEIGWDFSSMKHILEQDCDFDYYHQVARHINLSTVMLDIGCGSGEKSTRYFSLAKQIVMLDNEEEMLKKAKANVKKYYENKLDDKFQFVLADADKRLDFEDESFDLVVSRHCGANMSEVFRVLKKGGVFISEDIDHADCFEIKEYYGRGQNYGENSIQKSKTFQSAIEAGFSKIELLNFDQREYYPNPEQLKFLLCHTPIIDGYDEEKDGKTLIKYCKDFTTEKGILLNRRLYAFKLIK